MRSPTARGGRRLHRGLALALALVGAGLAARARAADPAAGGPPLLEAAERATLTAVGIVHEPERVDLQGRAAWLEVESVVAGEGTPGRRVRFAWEELAQGRPDRFAEGERVLVALAPLPSGSLWHQRFPIVAGVPPVRVVAAGGDAFLRRPDPVTVDLLTRYLALPAEERGGPPGALALARLVAGGEPVVAAASLRRLAELPGSAAKLGDAGARTLGGALEDAARPRGLRAAIVAFAGDQRVVALRSRLVALATPGGELEPEAIAALATLDGGLPADRAEALLASADPRVRAVAAGLVSGPKAEQRLAGLLRNDPSAEVRAAAATALLEPGGPGAVGDAAPGLFDRDSTVKAATAKAMGSLGERAVPTLQQLTMERSAEEAKGPIAALSLAGMPGARALVEIASTHPDPAVRTLARFALGSVPSHDRGGAELDPGSGPAAPSLEPPRAARPQP
ncbi:MAG TPA: HEAT repeat domain-containing protein [Myxococcota bacterium]|nr:HEAT repeat domain-containing protein [Myxococcota bacterium]